MSVNFPLLARHIENRGGWVAGQSSRQSLTTLLLNTTAPWDALPGTAFWRRQALDEQGHAHLFGLYQLLQEHQDDLRPSLGRLLSLFHLARWDPRMVARLWPAVCNALEHSNETQRQELARGIERSLQVFFPVPGEEWTVADVAVAYFDWLGENPDRECFKVPDFPSIAVHPVELGSHR